MLQRYKLNTSRLSLRECLSFGKLTSAPLFLACRVLGINLADDAPIAAEIQDIRFLPFEELPQHVSQQLAPICAESEKIGTISCFSYQFEALQNILFGTVFVSPDRSFSLEHIWAHDDKKNKVTSVFVSPRKGIGNVATTNQKRVFDPESNDLVKFSPQSSIERLLRAHLKRIKKIPVQPIPIDAEHIRDWILGRERKGFQEFIDRGLFVPL